MPNNQDFKQQQIEFAAHLRHPNDCPAPEGMEDRRLAIYRNLFINSLSSLVAGTYPVIRSLFSDDRWEDLIRSFYQPDHNRTPHFPEIPREFLSFIQNHPGLPIDKPFLAELALYEWLELHLDKHLFVDTFQPGCAETQIPVVNGVCGLNAFQFPVHQISQQHQPQQPLENPVFLLLWRNQNQRVQFTELNAFSALLFERLQANDHLTGLELLQQLSHEIQAPDSETFAQHGLNNITQWHEQGIISHYRSTT